MNLQKRNCFCWKEKLQNAAFWVFFLGRVKPTHGVLDESADPSMALVSLPPISFGLAHWSSSHLGTRLAFKSAKRNGLSALHCTAECSV